MSRSGRGQALDLSVERKSQWVAVDRQERARFTPTHRDPGHVNKTLVEMVQRCLGLFLGLEADEAELAELAAFGELEAAVRQCAEGGEQLPETLLLHLGWKGDDEGGEPGSPQSQGDKKGWKPEALGFPGGDLRRGGCRACAAAGPGSSSGSNTYSLCDLEQGPSPLH